MTRAPTPRAKGKGRHEALPEEELRRRHRDRAHRRKVAAALAGRKVDKRTARVRPDKAAGGRPPSVEAREAAGLASVRALLGRHRRPSARMRSDGLFPGYGMLLPFGDEPGLAATPVEERGR